MWTLRRADVNKMTAAELRFLRKIRGCSPLDMLCSKDIRSELKLFPMLKKLMNVRKEHVLCMERDTIPKVAYFYAPQDNHNLERLRKPWYNFVLNLKYF